MMKYFLLIMLVAHLLPTASLNADAIAQRVSLDEVTVALKPDKDPDRMLEERQALERYLSGELDRPVNVVIPMSSSVILEGFRNGSIDIAYLSSTDAYHGIEADVSDILLAGEINGKPYYHSYWVALKEKPYSSVKDLQGLPVAFASRTSTSGFLIPVLDLYERGLINPDDGLEAYFGPRNVFFGVGYVSAIERVLQGHAEAAAVSYYVLDEDRHLSQEQRDKLKMIASQGPVPTHTISVRSTLSPSDRQILKQVLLDMGDKNRGLRDKVFTSPLIEVNAEEHLKTTRKALQLIKRMPF